MSFRRYEIAAIALTLAAWKRTSAAHRLGLQVSCGLGDEVSVCGAGWDVGERCRELVRETARAHEICDLASCHAAKLFCARSAVRIVDPWGRERRRQRAEDFEGRAIRLSRR
jgi:hypothetical protein